MSVRSVTTKILLTEEVHDVIVLAAVTKAYRLCLLLNETPAATGTEETDSKSVIRVLNLSDVALAGGHH